MNVLLSSSGRRVELTKIFKQSNLVTNVFSADCSDFVATKYFSDKHFVLPRVDSENYIATLLDICRANNVHAVIPLIDTELLCLARARKEFSEQGTEIIVSSIDICEWSFDKLKTAEFFFENNINSPKALSTSEAECRLARGQVIFAKPICGSSSIGAQKITSLAQLTQHKAMFGELAIQEYIEGVEYTLDMLFSLESELLCVVPRKRLETRAGEIYKGVTDKNTVINNAAVELSKKMIGAVGPITAQCFLTCDSEVKFIEINPRFGGGYPLSNHAGANYVDWILAEMTSDKCQLHFDWCMKQWRADSKMLRYDQAIYVG